MTATPRSDELAFVKNYYNTLCNRPSAIQQYYMQCSKLTMCREQEKPDVCTEEFGKYIKSKMQKSVSKVLVSHLSHQKVGGNESIICVIGQMVYTDCTQERFSHQLLMTKMDSILYVKNESLIFLDEEICYDSGRGDGSTIVICHEKKNISDVVGFVSEFGGEIQFIESKGCRKLVVTLNADGVDNIKRNMEKAVALGYKIEFDDTDG